MHKRPISFGQTPTKCPSSSAGWISAWSVSAISISSAMQACALYLFLVTVADAQGLSFYADRSLCQRLSMTPRRAPPGATGAYHAAAWSPINALSTRSWPSTQPPERPPRAPRPWRLTTNPWTSRPCSRASGRCCHDRLSPLLSDQTPPRAPGAQRVADRQGPCRSIPARWPTGSPKSTSGPRKPRPHASKLDPFKPEIVRLLERYPYSAAQVFQRLREHGFDGGYSLVKAYVRTVRPQTAGRLSHAGLCSRRVCPGRLGLVRLRPGRANAPTAELLCHGPVLQPHAVRGVHRLPDHGALSGLPSTRL